MTKPRCPTCESANTDSRVEPLAVDRGGRTSRVDTVLCRECGTLFDRRFSE